MTAPLVVLVCGGRDWGEVPLDTPRHLRGGAMLKAQQERAHACVVLDALHAADPIGTIVHGAAPGADSLAEEWAVARGIPSEPFEADWSRHGRGAGPRRNTAMAARLRYLEYIGAYRPLVLAFPSTGPGTANMLAQARGKHLPVRACCELHPLPAVKP